MKMPEPLMELDCRPNALREELLIKNFEQKDGYIEVPNGKDLGISINEEKIEQYLLKS